MLGALSLCATAAEPAGEKPEVHVTLGGEPAVLSVDAKHAKLGQIIEALAKKTGVKAHYGVLPEDPVSAACAGEDIKSVMQCLLGSNANLLYRAGKGAPSASGGDIWVLGSSLADGQGECVPSNGKHSAAGDTAGKAMDPAELKRFVDMAGSEDAALRADALSQLTAEGQIGDAAVRHVFASAMSDKDPKVRAQAVYGLSRAGGSEAMGFIQEALQDSDADVRLMAVDSIAADDANGTALLKQALNDGDQVVRELAEAKMQSLESAGAQ